MTQSMLQRFICCRERFRISYIEGLQAADKFNFKLSYGEMFHLAEETYTKAVKGRDYKDEAGRVRHALSAVTMYAQDLARRHRLQQGEVDHWYEVCKVQFPLYVDYWKRYPDAVPKVNLLTEVAFDVPYTLPSGRAVRLRGKWDSVDLVGRGKEAAVYLTDHKTKGDVDEAAIKRQLSWDLQTMFYLVALKECKNDRRDDRGAGIEKVQQGLSAGVSIRGVFYNVIRRPLSGGKGSIVRHKATDGAKCPKCKGTGSAAGVCPKCDGRGRVGGKPEEPKADYYARVRVVIEAEPEHFFMRWRSEVIASDIAAFRRETLDPVLEQLCDYYECLTGCVGGQFQRCERHGYVTWRHPFGIYNPLDDGRETDVDEYLRSGSTAGLERKRVVFPELAV